MPVDVVVINGGSSSGKSSIVAELHRVLCEPWLALGIDTFIGALPPNLTGDAGGIQIEADGHIDIGASFTRLELCWMRGVAAMARSGAKVIVDDAFLSGPVAQQRWRAALDGLAVLWVGVHCAPEVATAREAARGDRGIGMAQQQALLVHQGIEYDIEVDTTHLSTTAAARPIVECLRERAGTAS